MGFKKSAKNVVTTVVPLALLGGGGFLIHQGVTDGVPWDRPPDLEAPVTATESQAPTGVHSAEVEVPPPPGTDVDKDSDKKMSMTPEKMEKSTIFVPEIGAYAHLDPTTGKVVNGALTLPKAKEVARWDKGADLKSTSGKILIAGHVNVGNVRGSLYNLANIKAGNLAYYKDASGNLSTYQLESSKDYHKEELPKSLWTTKGPKELVLITCGGELSKVGGSWHFDSNIVATFKPTADSYEARQLRRAQEAKKKREVQEKLQKEREAEGAKVKATSKATPSTTSQAPRARATASSKSGVES